MGAGSNCRSAKWRSSQHRVHSPGTNNKTFIFHRLARQHSTSKSHENLSSAVQHASSPQQGTSRDWQSSAPPVSSLRRSMDHLQPPVSVTPAGILDGIERKHQPDDASWFAQHRHPSDLPSAACRSKRLSLQQLLVQYHRLQEALHGTLQATLQVNAKVR